MRLKRLRLEAAVGFVGPFELNSEAAEGTGLPGADVGDFAVVVVVPALTGNGVGDGFAKFVGSSGGKGVEVRESAEAASAAGIRHYGVEDAGVADGVVIATEDFARGAAALSNDDTRRKKDEVKRIGCGGGEFSGGNF